MKLVPVVLFVYNRPWHTKQTVEALQKNKLADRTDLFIYSDGPKNEQTQKAVQEVRKYIRTIDGFKSVTIRERKENRGLANSIIDGVTAVVNKYGWVVVLEDDLVTSPFFLRYMNDALNLYEYEEKVISIAGYIYPLSVNLPATFFLRGADCWGWATWKQGWGIFDCDGKKLLAELKERDLCRWFDFNGTYPYTEMLNDQIAGKNDSWAVRWYASAFLANKLTLYPGRSLVNNIGHDSSGVHCCKSGRFDAVVSQHPITIDSIDVVENAYAYHEISRFLKRNIVVRILSRIKRAIKRVYLFKL